MRVLMTAWRLTFSSFAALSSSSSMEAVKSIFTRWMGFLIRPELVKKLETSLPQSAIRAMDSADVAFFLRIVVFIEFSFFPGRLPQGHQMVELPFCVFVNLKNHRIQTITYPTDRAMLNGEIGTLVGVVGMEENLLRLLETDSAPWIPPKALALPLIEVESHECITVISYLSREIKMKLGESTRISTARPLPLLVALAICPQLVAQGFTRDAQRVTVFSRTAILAPGGWASD